MWTFLTFISKFLVDTIKNHSLFTAKWFSDDLLSILNSNEIIICLNFYFLILIIFNIINILFTTDFYFKSFLKNTILYLIINIIINMIILYFIFIIFYHIVFIFLILIIYIFNIIKGTQTNDGICGIFNILYSFKQHIEKEYKYHKFKEEIYIKYNNIKKNNL
jgi:hypothetical protein